MDFRGSLFRKFSGISDINTELKLDPVLSPLARVNSQSYPNKITTSHNPSSSWVIIRHAIKPHHRQWAISITSRQQSATKEGESTAKPVDMASRTVETPYEGRDERVRSVGKKLLSKMKMALRRGDQTKRVSLIPVPVDNPEAAAESPTGPTATPATRYCHSRSPFLFRGFALSLSTSRSSNLNTPDTDTQQPTMPAHLSTYRKHSPTNR